MISKMRILFSEFFGNVFFIVGFLRVLLRKLAIFFDILLLSIIFSVISIIPVISLFPLLMVICICSLVNFLLFFKIFIVENLKFHRSFLIKYGIFPTFISLCNQVLYKAFNSGRNCTIFSDMNEAIDKFLKREFITFNILELILRLSIFF